MEELWELAWERHCARLPYQPAYKTLEEEKEKMAAKGWKQHPTDVSVLGSNIETLKPQWREIGIRLLNFSRVYFFSHDRSCPGLTPGSPWTLMTPHKVDGGLKTVFYFI